MTTPQTVVVEGLLVEISTALTTAGVHLHLVEALTDTHRPTILGFATVEGKEAAGRLVRVEREARRENERQGRPTGTGDIPGAGNIAAVSLLVDFHFTFQHAIRLCLRSITSGVPVFRFRTDLIDQLQQRQALGVLDREQTTRVDIAHRLVDALDDYDVTVNLGPSTVDLAEQLRRLSWWVTDPAPLTDIRRDLEHLNEAAAAFLDGTDRTRLNAGCPHCDRNTLVVYFEAGVVRCEKDPQTGRFEDCVCPEPICDCKTDPHHRHEWLRALGTAPNGWWKLADRIQLKTAN